MYCTTLRTLTAFDAEEGRIIEIGRSLFLFGVRKEVANLRVSFTLSFANLPLANSFSLMDGVLLIIFISNEYYR